MPRNLALVRYEGGYNRAAAYCDRCQRGFKTEHGLSLHIQDSRRHWECPTCFHDADGWDKLLDHCRETDCRSVCQGCDDGTGEHWDLNSAEYWDHVDDCHVCTECEEHHESSYELKKHEYRQHKGPKPKNKGAIAENRTYGNKRTLDEGYETDSYSDYQCLMCDRSFTNYSGMIDHLETGRCSPVDCRTLDRLAAQCPQWLDYVDQRYARNMRKERRINDYDEVYFCPCCYMPTTLLSGLFQHVESNSCFQTLEDGAIGSLREYIEHKLNA